MNSIDFFLRNCLWLQWKAKRKGKKVFQKNVHWNRIHRMRGHPFDKLSVCGGQRCVNIHFPFWSTISQKLPHWTIIHSEWKIDFDVEGSEKCLTATHSQIEFPFEMSPISIRADIQLADHRLHHSAPQSLSHIPVNVPPWHDLQRPPIHWTLWSSLCVWICHVRFSNNYVIFSENVHFPVILIN